MKFGLLKKIILPAVLLLSILLVSCGDDSYSRSVNTTSKEVNVEIVKGKAQKNILEFAGVVEGSHKVKMSTKLMGNVTYFPLEAGAAIKKGQVLAKIQSRDIEAKKQQVMANLSATEAAHLNMEKNYNRIKSLYERGSATEKEFDDVTLGYKMTSSQLKAAKEMKKEIEDVLSYSVLRAPFDGFIVNKFVQTGDIAAPGYPLLIVESFKNFNVVANVSSDNVNKLAKGNKVEVVVDAVNETKIAGEILEVNPGAHPASRQYSIKVKLDTPDELKAKIKSGMYARVLVPEKSNTKIMINKNLLVKRGQLAGVYTVNQNNEAVLRWLRLGKEINNEVEVLSGLKAGEKIITITDVKEGQKVEVK